MQTGLNPALEILYLNDSITVINELNLKNIQISETDVENRLAHREQRQYLPTEIMSSREYHVK